MKIIQFSAILQWLVSLSILGSALSAKVIDPVQEIDLNLDVSRWPVKSRLSSTNAGFMTLPTVQYSADPNDWHEYEFGIMIDAGSTGSRVHIYQWPKREFDMVPPPWSDPQTKEEWTHKIRPGISAQASDPDQAGPSLLPLIDFAKSILKPVKHRYGGIPIYLKATAGMRELNLKQQQQIMLSIRNTFQDNFQCPFQFNTAHARILSGEEEGAFAWTTVNYWVGTFLTSMAGFGAVQTKLSYGSLDLGGASTQIAFYRHQEDIIANIYKLQVGSQKHWNIYTHSFLLFGRYSAYRRYKDMLIDIHSSLSNASTIHDPCMQLGESTKRGNMTIRGAGNFTKCREEMIPLFHKTNDTWCNTAHSGQCSFVGEYQPELTGQFIAFSGYAKVYRWLGLPSDASLRMLGVRLGHACNMTMEELGRYVPHVKSKSTKRELCFMATYAYNLLHYGYGFPLDDTPITVIDKINGKEIDWVTGSVLYEVNALPWKLKNTSASQTRTELQNTSSIVNGSVYTAVLVGAALVTLGVSGAAFLRRNQHPQYEEIA